MPQPHASVSQGRICSDNFTCCHTEIEVADPKFQRERERERGGGGWGGGGGLGGMPYKEKEALNLVQSRNCLQEQDNVYFLSGDIQLRRRAA